MTEATMALMEYLRKHDLLESDFLRDAVQLMMQQLIELEVSEQVGAGHYERSAERVTQRNGYRPRQWETRVGQIPLRIPKLRQGSYFPSLLEPRKRIMRNLLARIPQRSKAMVAAAVRTIFAQPDRPAAGEQLEAVADALQPHWPVATELLRNAANDVLAFMTFPESHWRRIYSTNVLERLNKEVKRRTRVVEIFPNNEAVIRLVGARALEEALLTRRSTSNYTT